MNKTIIQNKLRLNDQPLQNSNSFCSQKIKIKFTYILFNFIKEGKNLCSNFKT